MKNLTLTLLAATTIGAISIGSASAMPLSNLSATPGDALVQDVRVVCERNGRCYNTYRTARRYAPQYYNSPGYYGGSNYYAAPRYGYYNGPRAGIGIGPFSFGMW